MYVPRELVLTLTGIDVYARVLWNYVMSWRYRSSG